jgi:choline dehydrogenase-like flavoprotein
MSTDTDVIVVGAGLAGLVAASELIDEGRRVIVLDQEPEASLGGQAFWSFGGLFLVDSPVQRHLGIHDSHDLALQRGQAQGPLILISPPASSPNLTPCPYRAVPGLTGKKTCGLGAGQKPMLILPRAKNIH